MDIKRKYYNIFESLFYSNNGLLAYTLYGRFRLQPTEAVDFINKYKDEGIFSVDDDYRICLTRKGIDNFLSIHHNVLTDGKKIDQDIVSTYLNTVKISTAINLFEPILPDILFYQKYMREKSLKETSNKECSRSVR